MPALVKLFIHPDITCESKTTMCLTPTTHTFIVLVAVPFIAAYRVLTDTERHSFSIGFLRP